MEQILKYAVSNNASDIHITEDKKSWVRINGQLAQYGNAVRLIEIDCFIKSILPDKLKEYIALRDGVSRTPVDGAFLFMSRRFRINIYKSSSGVNLAIRLLSDRILSLDELFLPDAVKRFTKIASGLFLVVGTTGSGKSTTLAAVIDAVNHSRSENILTIEQPIEYVHKPDKSRIEQIEVGVHIESFGAATVAAMRQNPNIILVGEMRDLETIQNAITLAETGHVVYGTLHAKSVTDTVDRMIDVFPPKQQEQIRIQLAGVLRGVLHQTLVRTGLGGLVPLAEQLVVDDVIAAMILGKQKSNSIRDYLRGKSALGNVHIADNAAWHIRNGRIHIEDVKNMLSPDDYSLVKAMTQNETGRGFYG